MKMTSVSFLAPTRGRARCRNASRNPRSTASRATGSGPRVPHKEAFKADSLPPREQYIDAELDRSTAVDFALEPGEAAFFNNAIVHGSNANFGPDRRILFLLEMVPTHAYQISPRESAV